MFVWLLLILGSATCGFVVAKINPSFYPQVLAGGVPALILTLAIVITEYTTPYQGGGASMWPIAVVVGGSVAAFIGVVTYSVVRNER